MKKGFINMLERMFEKFLWYSRVIIIIAVICTILSSFILILIGSFEVYLVFTKIVYAFSDEEYYVQFYKKAIGHIISAIDAYLIATVLIIFGIGLYELFISKIQEIEEDRKSSQILIVHSLDQLKEKLAKVIVMILIVTFFKHSINFIYTEYLGLLYLAIGIFLISLAIYFSAKSDKNK